MTTSIGGVRAAGVAAPTGASRTIGITTAGAAPITSMSTATSIATVSIPATSISTKGSPATRSIVGTTTPSVAAGCATGIRPPRSALRNSAKPGGIDRDEARGRLSGGDRPGDRPLKAPDLDRVRAEGAAGGKVADLKDRQGGGQGRLDSARDRPAAGEARPKAQGKDKAVAKAKPKANAAAADRRPVNQAAKRPAVADSKAQRPSRPEGAAARPQRPETRSAPAASGAFKASRPQVDRAASNRGAASRSSAGRASFGGGGGRGGGGRLAAEAVVLVAEAVGDADSPSPAAPRPPYRAGPDVARGPTSSLLLKRDPSHE